MGKQPSIRSRLLKAGACLARAKDEIQYLYAHHGDTSLPALKRLRGCSTTIGLAIDKVNAAIDAEAAS